MLSQKQVDARKAYLMKNLDLEHLARSIDTGMALVESTPILPISDRLADQSIFDRPKIKKDMDGELNINGNVNDFLITEDTFKEFSSAVGVKLQISGSEDEVIESIEGSVAASLNLSKEGGTKLHMVLAKKMIFVADYSFNPLSIKDFIKPEVKDYLEGLSLTDDKAWDMAIKNLGVGYISSVWFGGAHMSYTKMKQTHWSNRTAFAAAVTAKYEDPTEKLTGSLSFTYQGSKEGQQHTGSFSREVVGGNLSTENVKEWTVSVTENLDNINVVKYTTLPIHTLYEPYALDNKHIKKALQDAETRAYTKFNDKLTKWDGLYSEDPLGPAPTPTPPPTVPHDAIEKYLNDWAKASPWEGQNHENWAKAALQHLKSFPGYPVNIVLFKKDNDVTATPPTRFAKKLVKVVGKGPFPTRPEYYVYMAARNQEMWTVSNLGDLGWSNWAYSGNSKRIGERLVHFY